MGEIEMAIRMLAVLAACVLVISASGMEDDSAVDMLSDTPVLLDVASGAKRSVASRADVQHAENMAARESRKLAENRKGQQLGDSATGSAGGKKDKSPTQAENAKSKAKGSKWSARRRWWARRRAGKFVRRRRYDYSRRRRYVARRRRGFSAIPGKRFRWKRRLDLLGGSGYSTSYVGYGVNRDWYVRSGKTAGKVRIQDNGGEIYLLGGSYRTSRIGYGPSRNWYIRSGKSDGRVVIQDGGGDIWLLGGAGTHSSHIGWGNTKDWIIRSGKANGKVVLQDKGGKVQFLGGEDLRPSYAGHTTNKNWHIRS